MPLHENLAEGLNLAGTGMALVFVALVVFMLILMALQKLFPGEEMEPEMPEPEVETEEVLETVQVAAVNSDEEAPEPVVAMEVPARGGIPGPQLAAMAVSIYLAMEREEQAQAVDAEAPEPALAAASAPASNTGPAPQSRSGWGALGRANFLDSQGRRAPSYNHRPQSPFNPRGRDGR